MHRMHISRVVLGLALAASAALAASWPAIALAAEKQAEGKAAQSGGLVDINAAGVEELMSVPGIGEVIAQRIVEFRDKNGAYASVEDLIKVQGIGEKSLARIRDRLTAGKARK
ncbi:MAG: ComEA family DNA-binding protein [Candidatus Polarisedimenticolia bacterium]